MVKPAQPSHDNCQFCSEPVHFAKAITPEGEERWIGLEPQTEVYQFSPANKGAKHVKGATQGQMVLARHDGNPARCQILMGRSERLWIKEATGLLTGLLLLGELDGDSRTAVKGLLAGCPIEIESVAPPHEDSEGPPEPEPESVEDSASDDRAESIADRELLRGCPSCPHSGEQHDVFGCRAEGCECVLTGSSE